MFPAPQRIRFAGGWFNAGKANGFLSHIRILTYHHNQKLTAVKFGK